MKSRAWSFVAFLMLFSGCMVSVKDGIIPAKYLDSARPYTGTFRGLVDGVAEELDLSIDANNRVLLSVADSSGQLVPGCQSEIRNLESIDADVKKLELKALDFDFSSQHCGIQGMDLELDFHGPDQISLSIVKRSHRVCTQYPPHPCGPRGHWCPGSVSCSTVVDEWIKGTFAR
jgi:hypothetical protein